MKRNIIQMLNLGFIALRFLVWLIVVVLIYSYANVFVQEIKQLVFDNACAPEFQHHLLTTDSTSDYKNHVDWCETWWWHPFRLSITLLIGSVTGLLIFSITVAIVCRRDSIRTYNTLPISISITHTAFMLIRPSHKEYTQWVCRWHFYNEQITASDCAIQLGSFGDIRLYFPFAVATTCIALGMYRNRMIASKNHNSD